MKCDVELMVLVGCFFFRYVVNVCVVLDDIIVGSMNDLFLDDELLFDECC